MDVVALVALARNHYLDQYRVFVEQQRSSCKQGAPEVKLSISGNQSLFGQLYCADFVRNDGQADIIELQPDRVLNFSPIAGSLGNMSFSISHLRWDDVMFHHDGAGPSSEDLSGWFERWFDPSEVRHDPNAEFSNNVHSLMVEPGSISIDFGTADPAALWDILQLLERAGAEHIEISSSRAEAADPAN